MIGAPAQGDDPRLDLPEQDPRPIVALPRSGLPGAIIAIAVAILALALFLILDGRRRSAAPRADAALATPIASPPPLAVPPEPSPTPMVTLTLPPPTPTPSPQTLPVVPPAPQTVIIPVSPVAAPTFTVPETPQRPVARLSEPALVVDGGVDVRGTQNAAAPTGNVQGRSGTGGGTGDDAAARATVIRSRTDVMAVGTLIPAVLETPIDTARPGLVRAIVSRDTPGFDGRRVLVPRGSRLIGEYQADVRGGQNRVLVTWTRLIRPDGVSIRLGSPASDPLGGAGVPGQVHSFFLQRFAGAVLQSALTIGVNVASRPGNGSVIIGVPTAPINTIGQQLQPTNDYRPKITVKQGAALNVFVARDLDFSGVGSAR